ncbi:hypothetical protein Tco_1435284, partial [Tanacetum coccineum]
TTFPSSSGGGGHQLEEDAYDDYEDQFKDYPRLHQEFCDQFDFKVKCLVTPSDIQHSAATQIWGCYRLVSEPRVFWGADEEISDGGSPRVIVYGYDRLLIQLVAPPSPDYIPGPEDPQTPPVPQDEDETEVQPLPPVDSPTAESPGYITESDPEEDPEE